MKNKKLSLKFKPTSTQDAIIYYLIKKYGNYKTGFIVKHPDMSAYYLNSFKKIDDFWFKPNGKSLIDILLKKYPKKIYYVAKYIRDLDIKYITLKEWELFLSKPLLFCEGKIYRVDKKLYIQFQNKIYKNTLSDLSKNIDIYKYLREIVFKELKKYNTDLVFDCRVSTIIDFLNEAKNFEEIKSVFYADIKYIKIKYFVNSNLEEE